MCAAAAMNPPEGGAAMPENSGKAGGPKLFHIQRDDGTGVVPGGWETEKLDGKWYRKDSIEAEGIRDRRKVQTGSAPPPDKVNNEAVPSLGISKNIKRPKKTKDNLKARLKGRSSQPDMAGNITKDADLRHGGINL